MPLHLSEGWLNYLLAALFPHSIYRSTSKKSLKQSLKSDWAPFEFIPAEREEYALIFVISRSQWNRPELISEK
jgi:hypothetical protein